MNQLEADQGSAEQQAKVVQRELFGEEEPV